MACARARARYVTTVHRAGGLSYSDGKQNSTESALCTAAPPSLPSSGAVESQAETYLAPLVSDFHKTETPNQ